MVFHGWEAPRQCKNKEYDNHREKKIHLYHRTVLVFKYRRQIAYQKVVFYRIIKADIIKKLPANS